MRATKCPPWLAIGAMSTIHWRDPSWQGGNQCNGKRLLCRNRVRVAKPIGAGPSQGSGDVCIGSVI